jgi:hypothetical protein
MWDRRYHLFYGMYRVAQLGQKTEDLQKLADDLSKLRIIVAPEALGGRDPLLQKRFRELVSALPAASRL